MGCCLVRGSRPVGMSTGEIFVFAASFCTMRRFLCPKTFGRPCRAPNPEVGYEPGGVVNIRPCKQLVADLPPLAPGDILLHGHTHVPAWTDFGQGNLYLNPGSVSIPKENTAHSYMTLEGSTVCWKTMEGACYHQLQL